MFTGWEELWGFHDTQLGPQVRFAYQALAIDEERQPYEPTLWTTTSESRADQVLEQVWFAGVHSEVGGGTQDSALSDIALLWMVDKAAAADQPGLRFRDGWRSQPPGPDVPAPEPNYAGPLRQSRHGIWEIAHPLHRLTSPKIQSAPHQFVASTAEQRHVNVDGYNPPGLTKYLSDKPVQHIADVTGE